MELQKSGLCCNQNVAPLFEYLLSIEILQSREPIVIKKAVQFEQSTHDFAEFLRSINTPHIWNEFVLFEVQFCVKKSELEKVLRSSFYMRKNYLYFLEYSLFFSGKYSLFSATADSSPQNAL